MFFLSEFTPGNSKFNQCYQWYMPQWEIDAGRLSGGLIKERGKFAASIGSSEIPAMKTGRVLIVVVAAMLVGMTLYETAKNFLLPDLSLWQSHMITISFSGVIALLIGYVTLNKYSKFLARRDETERDLRLAHDALEARVTARKAELFESMKEAELANRAKSEIMTNVSHELRTPLKAIIGFSSMMTEQMFGPLDGKY